MAGQPPDPSRRSVRRRRVIQVVLSMLLVVGIFVVVFQRVDLTSVWAVIQDMTWIELATVTAISVWNLTTYGVFWMAVLGGLSFSRAMILTQSGTAVTNTVPGGSALGVGLTYRMLDSWGFSRTRSTLAVLVSGAWNAFLKFTLPVLALVLVALQGDTTPRRVAAGLSGIGLLLTALAIVAAILRSDDVAYRIGELAGRAVSQLLSLVRRQSEHHWGPALVRFRSRAGELVSDRWLVITVAAVVSHLSLYLVLLVTLRHAGISDDEVGWAQVLAVFAFARLVTAVRFTPGGAGVVEAVLISGFVAAGGESARVAAAVLVFRAVTWLLPIPLGVLAYVYWRSWRRRHGSPAASGAEHADAALRSQ
jgi:putative heme transporter